MVKVDVVIQQSQKPCLVYEDQRDQGKGGEQVQNVWSSE
jgi:hypothetical protein